jgi:hypothetical protein
MNKELHMLPSDFDVSCPTDGQLRAHRDTADPAIAAHVAGCDDCARRTKGLSESARVTARAIASLDDRLQVDTEAALAALPRPGTPRDWRSRWSRLPTGVAAALVALVMTAFLVFTPTGRQAAAGFLDQFRAERFEIITVDQSTSFEGLESFGDIADINVNPDEMDVAQVGSLDEASRVAGFTPTRVLDQGRPDLIAASAPSSIRMTFSAERAPDLPPELDGASLIVSVPGMVSMQFGTDQDPLMVAEAEQLVVDAEGADLEAIRTYLLNRPEVPDDLARQLLAIDDWTATLPVPVPVDQIAWRETTVAGQPGLMLEDPMGAGLLWHHDGRIHAVAGTAGIEELRHIANTISG